MKEQHLFETTTFILPDELCPDQDRTTLKTQKLKSIKRTGASCNIFSNTTHFLNYSPIASKNLSFFNASNPIASIAPNPQDVIQWGRPAFLKQYGNSFIIVLSFIIIIT